MKKSFLVDTNLLSESSRRIPSPEVMEWLENHDPVLHLSSITLGELHNGIFMMPKGKRKIALQGWLDEICLWAEGRILLPDQVVMKNWGELCAKCEKRGEVLSVLDSLIAATALTYDLTVATRNTGDFPKEVDVCNPWKA